MLLECHFPLLVDLNKSTRLLCSVSLLEPYWEQNPRQSLDCGGLSHPSAEVAGFLLLSYYSATTPGSPPIATACLGGHISFLFSGRDEQEELAVFV